jgi:hypothetical protein
MQDAWQMYLGRVVETWVWSCHGAIASRWLAFLARLLLGGGGQVG